jgi:hypothetical protein
VVLSEPFFVFVLVDLLVVFLVFLAVSESADFFVFLPLSYFLFPWHYFVDYCSSDRTIRICLHNLDCLSSVRIDDFDSLGRLKVDVRYVTGMLTSWAGKWMLLSSRFDVPCHFTSVRRPIKLVLRVDHKKGDLQKLSLDWVNFHDGILATIGYVRVTEVTNASRVQQKNSRAKATLNA